MFQYFLHTIFLIQSVTCAPPKSLREWLNNRLVISAAPAAYVLRLENEQTVYANFKSKRSVAEGMRSDGGDSFVAEIVREMDELAARHKRTARNHIAAGRPPPDDVGPLPGPKDLHLKANLRYHHQQRHPNGSVSGSYAQMDPASARLHVIHYVNDENGFREYAEEGGDARPASLDAQQPTKSASGRVHVVTNSDSGMLPPGASKQNRRGVNPLDGSNLNFVSTVNAPYSVAGPVGGIAPTPILHSAAGSVSQFSPKSPLFDKYYRPSPEEVQKSYEYHRIRSSLDPNSFRPTDMTPIPDLPRDKQPELRSVYGEYQIPYAARAADDPAAGHYGPTDAAAPPLVPHLAPMPPVPPLSHPTPADMYAGRPLAFAPSPAAYPQTLEPQAPIYAQSYDGQPFVPASTYSGPYLPNTATFNQPYPTNIPIYSGPVPQNVPTYSQPAPENVPVYGQPPLPGYGQNVYYASASNAQPAVIAKH